MCVLRRERDKLKQLLAADSENVDAYLGVCIERDEAREKIKRQAERICQLEGATNHAGGTPLSIALRERDEASQQYDNLAAEHMLAVNKFAEERDGQDAPFRVAVQRAIDKGTSFLRKELSRLDDRDIRAEGDEENRSYHSGRLALGLLAMIKGGVKKDDKVLLAALDELRSRKLIDSYSLGNALMALEAYHSGGQDSADLAQGTIDRARRRTVPDKDKQLMQKWTTLLLDNIDTRVDPQYLLRFNYVRDRRFDNSVNQYGLLGLYSAHLCGIETSPAHWEAAANHLITAQCESNGTMDLDLLSFRALSQMQARTQSAPLRCCPCDPPAGATKTPSGKARTNSPGAA
jgi:hypothetical protein